MATSNRGMRGQRRCKASFQDIPCLPSFLPDPPALLVDFANYCSVLLLVSFWCSRTRRRTRSDKIHRSIYQEGGRHGPMPPEAVVAGSEKKLLGTWLHVIVRPGDKKLKLRGWTTYTNAGLQNTVINTKYINININSKKCRSQNETKFARKTSKCRD